MNEETKYGLQQILKNFVCVLSIKVRDRVYLASILLVLYKVLFLQTHLKWYARCRLILFSGFILDGIVLGM